MVVRVDNYEQDNPNTDLDENKDEPDTDGCEPMADCEGLSMNGMSSTNTEHEIPEDGLSGDRSTLDNGSTSLNLLPLRRSGRGRNPPKHLGDYVLKYPGRM
ncbi:unnamed protein product [Lepeophtheirus salmonis]|uniref:(salmon louse) hypothetical protein n=1 Tax=Lepeophtheirus salmonis TaxID=72036 RepID=A0A7R8CFA3_LEPSM|nr:unnamed protein product [Lepeophtheirus salmonis]CAF2798223.1 unnamed protein product [Lepeophtheirus salmonis]